MTLKQILATLIPLTGLLFSPNALSVDKQMSSAMKSKMRSICSTTDDIRAIGKLLKQLLTPDAHLTWCFIK